MYRPIPSIHPLPSTSTATTISHLQNYNSFRPGLPASTLAPNNLLSPFQEKRSFKPDYAPLLLKPFKGSLCKFLTQSRVNGAHLRLIRLFPLLICKQPCSSLRTLVLVNFLGLNSIITIAEVHTGHLIQIYVHTLFYLELHSLFIC